MFKYSIFTLFFLVMNHTSPAERQKINVLIIPIEESLIKSVNKNLLNLKSPPDPKFVRNDEFGRLDISSYEEPAQTPDIDSFEYSKDRGAQHIASNKGDDSHYGDDKIVGGTEVADINLYPYHIAYGSNCGGAIIDAKWVITAGHCGKKHFIRVGSKYMNDGEMLSIKNHYVHPNWFAPNKEHPFDYDFQLIELSKPIKFNENIQPVKLAHMGDMVIGKVITVTGWGNTEENGPFSNTLRAVRVPVIAKENCQNVPFPYFRGTLTPRMFCAGFSEGEKDACQGDSGGPAVSNDRLLGMVSFGYGCATPGAYGVYSKIAKVRPWIETVTGLDFD